MQARTSISRVLVKDHARWIGRRHLQTTARQCIEARAIIYEQTGEPSQIIRAHKWTLPTPKAGQVVLRVGLASINPADINVLQGVYPAKSAKRKLPGVDADVFIGGNEGFGVVEESSGLLKKGDWVVFGKPQMGTWASHMVCGEKDVIKIERQTAHSLSPIMASTLQVNPATAYRMLHDFEQIKQGDIIIQNAANSAVGQAVVQICSKKLGAESINLIRDRPDLSSMKQLFADLSAKGAPAHLFTYQELADRESGAKEKIKKLVGDRKIKLGLNAVCGKDNQRMSTLMGSRSTLVTYGAMSKQPFSVPAGMLIFQDMTVKGFMMNQWYASHSTEERHRLMKDLVEWYEEGSLQPPPSKVIEIGADEDIEQVTQKARDAVRASMEGFGGHKLFFRFQ